MKKIQTLFKVISSFFVVITSLSSQVYLSSDLLQGDDIILGATIEYLDSACDNPPNLQCLSTVQFCNYRTFVQLSVDPLDPNDLGSFPPTTTYNIEVTFQAFDVDGNNILNISNGIDHKIEAEISSLGGEYEDVQIKFFEDQAKYLKIEIMNVEIEDALGNAISEDPPISAALRLGGETDSYIQLANINPNPVSINEQVNSNEIEFSFNEVSGAISYDLEWTWVDNEANIDLSSLDVDHLFKYNSSRVNIKSNVYEIANIYRGGHILARYRALGFRNADAMTPDCESIHSTNWSLVDQSNGNQIISWHQDQLNWQHSRSYAEEGKSKDVINYFDGSLRSRQTVSKLESEDHTIATETVYDHVGRPAIQILPSPVINENNDGYIEKVDYISNLHNGYNYSNFENTNDCDLTPQALGTDFGASRYYSNENNVRLTDDEGLPTEQSFVPIAEGYPFSHTVYTQDGTGRVRYQGGVGKEHQIGTDHETKYYYGIPAQEEIDRLFGNEVGYAKYYKKNLVVDPNGQVSVSYLDNKNRVIATALAGEEPKLINGESTVDALSTMPETPESINQNISDNNHETDEGPGELSYSIDYQWPNSEEGNELTINYSFDKLDFSDECIPEDICFDCEYKVEINIYDDCGVPLHSESHNTGNLTEDMELDICNNSIPFTIESIINQLPVQNYTINKNLQLDESYMDAYEELYVKNYLCEETEIDIFQTLLSEADLSGCVDAVCLANVEPLISQYILEHPDLTLEELKDYVLMQLEECETNTVADINYCDELYRGMLNDVSPGGMYGTILYSDDEVTPVNPISASESCISLSVFYENVEGMDYEGIGSYKDLDGSITVNINGVDKALNSLELTEIVNNWDDSWAMYLIELHPEHDVYQWCSSVQVTEWMNFEALFLQVETFEEANSLGYLNPLGLTVPTEYSFISSNTPVPLDLEPGVNYVVATTANGEVDIYDLAYLTAVSNLVEINDLNDVSSMSDIIALDLACDHQKFWEAFKTLYVQLIRNPFIRNDLDDCLTSNDCIDENSSDALALINVILNNQESGVCPDINQAFIRFPFLYQITDDENSSPDFGFPDLTENDMYDETAAEDELSNLCSSTCESYKEEWREQLSECVDNPIPAVDMEDILNLFISICTEGCDSDHIIGSSTLPGGVTVEGSVGGISYTVSGFEDLLNQYMDNQSTEITAGCNALLISSPPPYDVDIFAGEMPFIDDCVCEKYNTAWELEFVNSQNYDENSDDLLGDFVLFLKDTYGIDYEREVISDIDCVCRTLGQDNEYLRDKPMSMYPIPEPFTCSVCIECDQMAAVIEEFYSSQYGMLISSHTTPKELIEDAHFREIFTNWTNQYLNFNLTFIEYFDFATFCGTTLLSETEEYTELDWTFSNNPDNPPCNGTLDLTNSPDIQLRGSNCTDESGTTLTTYCITVDQDISLSFNWSATMNESSGIFTNDEAGYILNGTETYLAQGNISSANGSEQINLKSGDEFCFSVRSNNKGKYVIFDITGIVFFPNTNCLEVLGEWSFTNEGGGGTDGIVTLLPNPDNMVITGSDNGIKDETTYAKYCITAVDDLVVSFDWSSAMIDTVTGIFTNDEAGYSIDGVETELAVGSISIDSGNEEINISKDEEFCFFVKSNNTAARNKFTISAFDVKYDGDETNTSLCDSPPLEWMLPKLANPCAKQTEEPGEMVAFLNKSLENYLSNPQAAAFPGTEVSAWSEFTTSINFWQNTPGGSVTLQQEITDCDLDGSNDDFIFRFVNSCNQELLCEICMLDFDITEVEKFTDISAALDFTFPEDYALKVDYINNEYYLEVSTRASSTCYSFIPCEKRLLCNRPLNLEINLEEDDCVEATLDLIEYESEEIYKTIIENARDRFKIGYTMQCMNKSSLNEDMNLTFDSREYHHTLYYYDQSGSLVRTIPPKGVVFLTESELDAVEAHRMDPSQHPAVEANHTMPTNYLYNSMGSISRQNSPDADIIDYWYDELGRPILSQDGRQRELTVASNNQYFYGSITCYDELGRVMLTAELKGPFGSYAPYFYENGNVNNKYTSLPYQNFLGSLSQVHDLSDVVFTVYDDDYEYTVSGNNDPYSINEEVGFDDRRYLRKRISSTFFVKSGYNYFHFNNDQFDEVLWYDHATHYDYDIHGNVKTIIQDFKALKDTEHSVFRTDYDYDLISGNVNMVSYQHDETDQFYHKYEYDADNRLVNVKTSRDKIIWDNDASYNYYDHGPLARTELGQYKVQGMDYIYTIHGWIKAVNSANLHPERDPGRDGIELSNGYQSFVANDAFAYSLDYYNSGSTFDYKPVNEGAEIAANIQPGNTPSNPNALYNGNISRMMTGLRDENNFRLSLNPNAYRYDQLHRITESNRYNDNALVNDASAFEWVNQAIPDDNRYKSMYQYDGNGNILNMTRNGENGTAIDELSYSYPDNQNLLLSIDDAQGVAATTDIGDRDFGLESYDASGNLIKDDDEGIESIEWNHYGKIKSINKTGGEVISYCYDAMGNRISKTHINPLGEEGDKTTYYVRDASGNVMATYESTPDQNGDIETLGATEFHIYGSSRVGLIDLSSPLDLLINYPLTSIESRYAGVRRYELTNHLGNVLSVVTDNKIPLPTGINGDNAVSSYRPEVVRYSEYYPFGWTMPGRSGGGDYRYGFNGKESDPEVKGSGVQYDYGFRIYDSRMARFMSVDPLADDYPSWSSYVFAMNRVINGIDLDGAEWKDSYGNWTDEYNGRYVELENGNWLYSRQVESGKHQYWEHDGERWIDQGTGGGHLLHTKSGYIAVTSSQLFDIARMNEGLAKNILQEKYGTDLAKSFFISEIHRGQGKVAEVLALGGVTLLTGGLAIETAPLWLPAVGKFFTIKASFARFAADGIVQGGISFVKGESIVDNYNFASGVSSFFLANPFASAGIGGTFNLSFNNTSFDLERGLISSVIGGSMGKVFEKTWTPFSNTIPRLSWKGGFGETLSIANPVSTGVGLGLNSFSKLNSTLGTDLLLDKTGNEER